MEPKYSIGDRIIFKMVSFMNPKGVYRESITADVVKVEHKTESGIQFYTVKSDDGVRWACRESNMTPVGV